MPELSSNERIALDQMPATTTELTDVLNCRKTYVYDVVSNLRQKGVSVGQTDGGEYIHHEDEGVETASRSARRTQSDTKAVKTRKARKLLSEMEHSLQEDLEGVPPAISDSGAEETENGAHIIYHRTDDHFGQQITDQRGEVVYDSEIAEARVRQYFDRSADFLSYVGDRHDIEAAHLLLGGDIITNENIYDGQAHEIDEDLAEQISRSTEVYMDEIRRLSQTFPRVQVVCQAGNHGELRGRGSSEAANADDIVYMMLDKMVRESEMENVTFIQNDETYFVDFTVGDWDVHLRHGHDASLEHIGTSAGKQRWLSWLNTHQFDVAFRGHYHMYKEEPVNGVPVHMGGSLTPTSEFEESRAIFGRPTAAVHAATENEPTEYTKKIYFD